MKSSTLPAVRVHDDLRADAENVLAEGETLTSFIESATRRAVERRQVQAAFEERAKLSRAKALRTGIYHPADDVHAALRARAAARRKELLG